VRGHLFAGIGPKKLHYNRFGVMPKAAMPLPNLFIGKEKGGRTVLPSSRQFKAVSGYSLR
jgi:hypothetical protein